MILTCRNSALIAAAVALPCLAQPKWWMDEPVRLVQTNLRETDASLDPARLAKQLAEFPANALLFGMGGIVAYYPTQVGFHYPSPYMPRGRDLFGDMLREAHARGIRVIGRFDLSKTQKPVYDVHPEWFFRKFNGEPVVYNGLYSTCINGGYYRSHAMKILTEALERYEVDGLFFNMFGNPSTDYSGNPVGLCHCEACIRRFRERYGKALPERPDTEYRSFMDASRLEVAAAIGRLIHEKRPRAGFFTYIQQHTDGIMSESNTSVTRPLPLWPYSASDNVNRARNSEPGKMAINLCMSFVDFPWRHATVPAEEVKLRLYQNMAHGAGPAFVVLGTLDQDDQQAILAARPVFEWHARNQDLYVKQESGAQVLLLGSNSPEYRGLFRLLSEQHIPFAVSDNLDWIKSGREFDLVIAPGRVPPQIVDYVARGGSLLITGAEPPAGLGLPHGVRRPVTKGYWRVRDRDAFPTLKDTSLLFLDGEYVEFPPAGSAPLTLVPPSIFGPPEKVFTDAVETKVPGLLTGEHGKGRFAYVNWNAGALYYRHSSPSHAAFLADVIDGLLPSGRQIRTDAHPLLEMTLMRQVGRTLLHLVNMTGHSSTAYFEPVRLRNVRVDVAQRFSRAYARALGRPLEIRREGNYSRIMLPEVERYEVLVLE